MIYCLDSAKIAKTGTSKLSPEQVIEIRKLVAEKKVSQYSLAKRFAVSQACISKVVNRLVWPEL